jgi:hypothetical protein
MFPRLSDMRTQTPRLTGPIAAVLVSLLLAACAVSAPGAASDEAGSASPAATEPTDFVPPASGGPDPIPDASLPVPYPAGEPVAVGGATLTYDGLEIQGDQLVARFVVVGGLLDEPLRLILAEGGPVDVTQVGTDLVSEPFGSAASPPASRQTLTLQVGTSLIQFIVGPVD